MNNITNNLDIKYSISFEDAKQHYADIEMNIENWNNSTLTINLPVWIPGSYLVREFQKSITKIQAFDNHNTELCIEKTTKNSWLIKTESHSSIKIKYRIYAFELTVRTAYIDDSHAFFNGANVFMFIDGHQNIESKINIIPNKDWNNISCGIDSIDKYTFKANNYDELADCPFEVGNQIQVYFDIENVTHEIAIVGPGNYNTNQLVKDFKTICQEAISVFKTLPCKKYTFIIHCTPSGRGGLEHLNSTVLQIQRFAFSDKEAYNDFLSLVAHEYFHLWNVKRLRPETLGPFNYNEENYTSLLWFSEGFTSYYDKLIPTRAGFYTEEEFINFFAAKITNIENLKGNKVQCVAESSFDAWIKHYRQNENSPNTTVSYYEKGAIIAFLIECKILGFSKGEKNLDDLMQYLYQEYAIKQNRGFSEKELKQAMEIFCGKSLNDFFMKYIWGTESINYDEFLNKVGFKASINQSYSKTDLLGVKTRIENGKIIISQVEDNTSAYVSGLNVNDEIIAINNYRVNNLSESLSIYNAPQNIDILVSRNDILKNIPLELNHNIKYSCTILKDIDLLKIKNKWLNTTK